MRCLREALARVTLGQPRSLQLAAIATDALLEGIDSPSLRILAGLDAGPAIGGEREEYFRKACAELGITIQSRKEAARYLIDLWLADIREGRIPPHDGCCKIISEVYYGVYDVFPDRNICGDALGISELVGAYWNYEDLEEREMIYEGRLVGKEEGRRILDSLVMSYAQKKESAG